jgi:hypothetical protein
VTQLLVRARRGGRQTRCEPDPLLDCYLLTREKSLNVACGEAAEVLWYSLRTFDTHSAVISWLAMLYAENLCVFSRVL